MLHFLDGRLIFELNGTSHEIEAGGSVHARTVRDHSYACPDGAAVHFIMAVHEPGNDGSTANCRPATAQRREPSCRSGCFAIEAVIGAA